MKGRTIRILVLVLILILGGSGYLVWKLNHNTKAQVVLVSTVSDSYYGDSSTLDGTVSEGSTQYVDMGEGLVEAVNVEVGQQVKKGDTLVTFDTTSYKLTIEHDEADIKVIESQIAMEEEAIKKYQSLLPSESAPAPKTITVPGTKSKPLVNDVITTATSYVGTGAENNPLVFECCGDTVVKAEVLMGLGDKIAIFEMYDGLGYLGKWTVKGTPSEVKGDWVLGEGVTINKDGTASVDFSVPHYGTLETKVPDYTDGSYTYTETVEPDANGNYQYSRAELASMVEDAKKQLQELQLSLREANLKLKQDQLVMDSGKSVASFDGVVMAANDPNTLGSGDHIVTLKGAANGTVTAYIGELRLNEVQVGDQVTVMAYESGNNFSAIVREIGDDPLDDYTKWGENPNNSYYPITCEPEEQVQLNIGEWCEITLAQSEEASNAFYIPLSYVRDDTDGTYAYVADENGRLEKRYLKTGKTVWGSMIEIISGLSKEDLVAFPYGKEAYAGNKTEQVDYIQ